jgi:tRNA(adenine34) deaminase
MPESLDVQFMQRALALARRAQADGEVPVGAIVVRAQAAAGDAALGEGWNRPIAAQDPTAHAEILALRAAAAACGSYRLNGCALYVTLEPCVMCMGAIINARIDRLIFGAWDPKAGACGSILDLSRDTRLNHRVDAFGGVCGAESRLLLRGFFEARR